MRVSCVISCTVKSPWPAIRDFPTRTRTFTLSPLASRACPASLPPSPHPLGLRLRHAAKFFFHNRLNGGPVCHKVPDQNEKLLYPREIFPQHLRSPSRGYLVRCSPASGMYAEVMPVSCRDFTRSLSVKRCVWVMREAAVSGRNHAHNRLYGMKTLSCMARHQAKDQAHAGCTSHRAPSGADTTSLSSRCEAPPASHTPPGRTCHRLPRHRGGRALPGDRRGHA